MSDFTTRLSTKAAWLRALGTLVSLALLVYLFSQQGWGQITSAICQIPLWRLGLALALMFISRLSVAMRWYVLLRSAPVRDASGETIPLRQTLRITWAGLFASNFLPTTIGGDLARLVGILQLRYDAAVCAASLVVDRLVGMAGMAMAAPFSLPIILNLGSVVWRAARAATVFQQGHLPLALSLGLSPSGDQRGDKSRLGGWSRAIWDKGWRIAQKLYAALRLWLKQPRALLASLAFSWLHMLCLFSIIYLLVGSMGEEMPIWMIGGLYSLVYFVTLIPISINGYGLQEISMTLIFSNLGQAPLSAGLTTALLFRTLMMTASLPGAIFLPDIVAYRALAARERAGQETP